MWFPDKSNFTVSAGQELLARQDYPAALCYLSLAEKYRQQDPAFQTDLGIALWETGKTEPALSRWEQALALDPAQDEALDRLWNGYVQTRQWPQAEDAIHRWLTRHAGDPQAVYMLALIQAANDPGSALENLDSLKSAPAALAKKALELSAVIRAALLQRVPEYIFARTGEELLSLGEPALAEAALQRAIDRNPKYGEAYALLGAAQEAAGEIPGDSYRRESRLRRNPRWLVYCTARGCTAAATSPMPGGGCCKPGRRRRGIGMSRSELAQVDFTHGQC